MFATVQKMDGGYVARFDRHLKHPPEKVWAALTEPEKLAKWLADASMEPKKGGRLKLTFNTTEGDVAKCTITEFIPLSVFAFTWGKDLVRFELQPENDGCLLILKQFFNHLGEQQPMDLAGWHVHIDIIPSVLEGKDMDFSYSLWEQLYDIYTKMQNVIFQPPQPPTVDETEIRMLYRQLLDNWNKRSGVDMAQLFAEQGELIGFDGSQIAGRKEIASHLVQIFADHPTAAYIGKVRNVRLMGSALAVLRAVAGMIPTGQSELKPELNAHQTLITVKRAGKWYITLFQNTPAQFHGRPELVEAMSEELRELLS